MTQIYIKQNIHKHRTQNFRRISPFGITPVEKAHNADGRNIQQSINRNKYSEQQWQKYSEGIGDKCKVKKKHRKERVQAKK